MSGSEMKCFYGLVFRLSLGTDINQISITDAINYNFLLFASSWIVHVVYCFHSIDEYKKVFFFTQKIWYICSHYMLYLYDNTIHKRDNYAPIVRST